MRSVGGCRRVQRGIWPGPGMQEGLPWGWVLKYECEVQRGRSEQEEQCRSRSSGETEHRPDSKAEGVIGLNPSSSLPGCSPS